MSGVEVALTVVCLAVTVIVVTHLCQRLDLPAPLVLIAVGIIGSFLPFIPELHLSSELVLLGLLPPLLYSASLQTSLVDFNAQRRAILLLSIGLVIFTTAGVAVVVQWVLPGLSWPAAFAIGAVVAPPDAVAATAIARRIGLPRKIVTILEGESLLNDATALVALATAIAAASEEVTVTGVTLEFIWAAGAGVLVGIMVFAVVGWVRRHVTDPVTDSSVSLVTPFLAYVAAEGLHASGVLGVVVAGLLLGHKSPILQTAPSRISERLNWLTISFLLENAVFLLIGLQARWIVEGVAASELGTGTVVAVCVAAFAAVVLLRLAWVFPARYLLVRPGPDGRRAPATYTFVLGWAGMRGVVTLAAAFVIPADFPHRQVLLLIAFTVTAGTLLVQGSTLPWVVRMLRVPAPDPREEALDRAILLQEATTAGLAWLDRQELGDVSLEVREVLQSRVEQRAFSAWESLAPTDAGETPSDAYARLRLQMLEVERARVLEIRSEGRLPHEVIADVLATLDVEESMIDIRTRRVAELRSVAGSPITTHAEARCEHLDSAAVRPVLPDERVCVDCVVEGTRWVHLRVCLTCRQLRCCDSSPRRHSTAHFHQTGHPVIQSAQPGETWRWCYVDELVAD
jgi:CPA1 family monovalent cation:H+ antiporter